MYRRQRPGFFGPGLLGQSIDLFLEIHSRRKRQREPDVVLMGSLIVMRDAGVGVYDRRCLVLARGIDLHRHQRSLVTQHAGIENCGYLAHDPSRFQS
jgi:hypothetical protein